jgi:uncharacterized protein with PIN domain
MNRARGFIQFIGPEGTTEFETFTCAHCNRIVRMPHPDSPEEMKLKVRDVRHCHQCDSMTCPECARRATCEPFEKWLDAYERRERLRAMATG